MGGQGGLPSPGSIIGHKVSSAAGLQSEAWGRTPQPAHPRDTGGGAAATATFRWDQGWTLAAPREPPGPAAEDPSQRAPGAASSLSEDISGTPGCDTGDRLLRLSTVPSTQSPSLRRLGQNPSVQSPCDSFRRRVPLAAVGPLSWRGTPQTVSCTARHRSQGGHGNTRAT